MLTTERALGISLLKLGMLCGSLQTASAHDIVAVMPILAFAAPRSQDGVPGPHLHQDHRTDAQIGRGHQGRGLDVHNVAAIQNAYAFDIQMDNLECKNLFAAWFADKLKDAPKVVVLSPARRGS